MWGVMKLSTIPKRPTIWSVLADRHRDQADECLRLVNFYAICDKPERVKFWQGVWKAKQADYDYIKDLYERGMR